MQPLTLLLVLLPYTKVSYGDGRLLDGRSSPVLGRSSVLLLDRREELFGLSLCGDLSRSPRLPLEDRFGLSSPGSFSLRRRRPFSPLLDDLPLLPPREEDF